MDAAITVSKDAKTASKASLQSLPPSQPPQPPQSLQSLQSMQPLQSLQSLQERKRKRDESNYTCRGIDMEIRLAEAHRLNMTLAIEQIRAVIRSRD